MLKLEPNEKRELVDNCVTYFRIEDLLTEYENWVVEEKAPLEQEKNSINARLKSGGLTRKKRRRLMKRRAEIKKDLINNDPRTFPVKYKADGLSFDGFMRTYGFVSGGTGINDLNKIRGIIRDILNNFPRKLAAEGEFDDTGWPPFRIDFEGKSNFFKIKTPDSYVNDTITTYQGKRDHNFGYIKKQLEKELAFIEVTSEIPPDLAFESKIFIDMGIDLERKFCKMINETREETFEKLRSFSRITMDIGKQVEEQQKKVLSEFPETSKAVNLE